jgi:DNA-binding CsgD family transcriptional regulator
MAKMSDATIPACAERWAGYCVRYLIAGLALESVRKRLNDLPETSRNGQALEVISECAGMAIAAVDASDARCRALTGLPCRYHPEVPFPRPHGSGMLSREQWDELARRLGLSPAELRVVQGVFDDCKEQTIARHLGVSGNTVHTHIKRLYLKLGVSGRVGLVLAVVVEFIWPPVGVSPQ